MANSFNELFGLGSHSEDANLEGWWPLQDDAASATVVDASSNGRDFAMTSGNTSDVSTTGPNSYLPKSIDVNSAPFPATTSFPAISYSAGTMLLWFRTDNASTQYLAGTDAGSGTEDYFAILKTASLCRMDVDDNSTGGRLDANTDSTDPDDGSWHCVGLTFTCQSTLYAFEDGSFSTETQSLTAQGATIDPGTDYAIGSGTQGGFLNSVAEIASCCIFSRELTEAECAQFYNGPEPINSVAPAVSGTETEGQTLSVTSGTWGLDAPFSSGSNGTITYAYQWTRSNDAGGSGEADISGATSSTYTLIASDVGKFIRCRVAASNDGGNDSAADTNSDMSGAISASGGGGNVGHLMLLGVG